jgi:ribosomal protein S18 acetylase RimI-like enzyme
MQSNMDGAMSLLARAEAVEAQAWADLAVAAPPAARRVAGLSVELLGAGCVISARSLPGMLFNRAIAIGREPAAIGRAVRHFQERDIGHFLLQLGPAARLPEVSALLRGHGIERYRRAWDKFVRGAAQDAPSIATDLEIRPARLADAEACGRLLAGVFATGERSVALFAALVDRPRWHVLVACAPGDAARRPVAVAGLFVHGDLGYLAFAATDPGFRRRGAQGALMARRIRNAASLGCRLLTTETGEPLPGQPTSSRDNMLRCGFRIAQRRENFAPAGATWAPS